MLKGRTTLQEVMDLSNRVFHAFYYRHYIYYKTKEENKKNGKPSVGDREMLEQMEELVDGG